MDLFADLPPPETCGTKQTEETSTEKTKSAASLFDDLPEPQDEDKQGLITHGEKRKLEDIDDALSKRPATQTSSLTSNFQLKGHVAERMGEREDMQDAHVILDDFTESFSNDDVADVSRLAYYAIFDGHAGDEASQFAAKHLHKNIIHKFPKGGVVNCKDREIKKCLIEAYRKTDEEFLQEASKHNPVLKDGSTAVSVLVVNDVLYVANLGDCKALLCRRNVDGKYGVVPLSKDHSPTQYEERLRIQKAGGNVRDGRVLGILEVSRSFGDGRFKGCGVIATPDVLRCSLTDKDRFLLLACDGLWKGFEVDEALKFINNILESTTNEDNQGNDNEEVMSRYEEACNRIASDAIRKGSSDNVTVMLVEIKQRE